jgi:predicted MFS family arabinose efflux permease
MLAVLALTVVLATFCFNFTVILPVLAKRTLESGPETLGLLSALFGGGALLGALLSAYQRLASLRLMVAGGALLSCAELLVAPERSIPVVGVLLFLTGVGFTLWTSNANTTLQLGAPDHLRGRVVGLYYYAFNATGPLGGIMAGWLSARGGTQSYFFVAGAAGLVGTLLTAAWLRRPARPAERAPAVPEVAPAG